MFMVILFFPHRLLNYEVFCLRQGVTPAQLNFDTDLDCELSFAYKEPPPMSSKLQIDQ